MDFAPDTPTAGYERYVSESESTDGEGDVSGGQQRRTKLTHTTPSSQQLPSSSSAAAVNQHTSYQRASPSFGYVHAKGASSSSSSSSSIFSRLAASWKKGSESVAAGTRVTLHPATTGETIGSHRHGNTPDHPAKAAPTAEVGGGGRGAQWTDIQEGSSRDAGSENNAGLRFGGGSSTAAAAAAAAAAVAASAAAGGVVSVRDTLAAGVSSMGTSSSGLKGLKTSLLTEDGDTAAERASDHPTREGSKKNGHKSSSSREKHGGVIAEGWGGGRGLWDEAAAGDLEGLSAALAPGGGGDARASNVDGWTALHSAAHAGHGSEVMSLLVRNGASPAAVARHGYTPLHSACMRGRWDAAGALLAFGADANARAADQRTPLHFACEAGSPECVKVLLQAGASPNVSDQDARTPLHFACIDGSTECVRRLLSAGASHFPPDAWGRDPAAVARQLDREGPLRLLEAAAVAAARGGNSSTLRGASSSGGRRVGGGRGGGGGDASGGSGDPTTASSETEKHEVQMAAAAAAAEASMPEVGKRWVVMNEHGRMLERQSGKVALFKSMAAAVDWANGLEITSGSFQVSEVAPSMRRAFEREIMFEITGGGTASEEEEEEKHDPQWTRYRRQQAAARKGVGPGSGGDGDRKRRGPWTPAVRSREEEKARALVAATASKLRDVTEEADMHRQKAASLERALEAVLKECEDLARAVEAADADPSTAGARTGVADLHAAVGAPGVPAEGKTEGESGAGAAAGGDDGVVVQEDDDDEEEEEPRLSESGSEGPEGSDEDSIDEDGDEDEDEERPRECSLESRSGENADAGATATRVPSLLIGVDEPAGAGAGAGRGDAAAAPSLLLGVDSPSQRPSTSPPPPAEGTAAVAGTAAVEENEERRLGGGGSGGVERSLLDFGDSGRHLIRGESQEKTRLAATAPATATATATDDASNDARGTYNSKGNSINSDSDGDGDGDRDRDSSDDGEAAAVERLTAWLLGLKIRKNDAARYAALLVADGFDSAEALHGVREEELVQYGMKKGHARFVITSLAAGFGL